MPNNLCPKTGELCPAKVLIAEFEAGELRYWNIDGSPLDVPSGRVAEILAASARKLLDEGTCSVGPEFDEVDEMDGDDHDHYVNEVCTNSNIDPIEKLGDGFGISLTYIHTELPNPDTEA